MHVERISMSCDVGIEPALQPLDHKPLRYATANRDGVHFDVVARYFWGRNRYSGTSL